jgi:hypothetical protein
MTATTSTPRATITGGPEGLEIVIPARRNLIALLFLGIWLAGWVTGELTALAELLAGSPKGPEGFLLLWLTLWTIAGALAAYTWLWMLVGKERILMGTSSLRMKRDILGLGRTRTFALFRIRNLRVASGPAGPRDAAAALRLAGLSGGLIAFEYEGKTLRFGLSLDPVEAQMIVERMKQRYAFPELPPTQPAGTQ